MLGTGDPVVGVSPSPTGYCGSVDGDMKSVFSGESVITTLGVSSHESSLSGIGASTPSRSSLPSGSPGVTGAVTVSGSCGLSEDGAPISSSDTQKCCERVLFFDTLILSIIA